MKTFEEKRKDEKLHQLWLEEFGVDGLVSFADFKKAFEAGQRSIGHCSCTMTQKMTGDGCSVCNPTVKREIDAYNDGYTDGQLWYEKVDTKYAICVDSAIKQTALRCAEIADNLFKYESGYYHYRKDVANAIKEEYNI